MSRHRHQTRESRDRERAREIKREAKPAKREARRRDGAPASQVPCDHCGRPPGAGRQVVEVQRDGHEQAADLCARCLENPDAWRGWRPA